MIDEREARKNRLINAMRREIKEVERVRKTPQGRRDFIHRYIAENFGIERGCNHE